jgi:hypothetical protein
LDLRAVAARRALPSEVELQVEIVLASGESWKLTGRSQPSPRSPSCSWVSSFLVSLKKTSVLRCLPSGFSGPGGFPAGIGLRAILTQMDPSPAPQRVVQIGNRARICRELRATPRKAPTTTSRSDLWVSRTPFRAWGAKTRCASEKSAICMQDANFGTPHASRARPSTAGPRLTTVTIDRRRDTAPRQTRRPPP